MVRSLHDVKCLICSDSIVCGKCINRILIHYLIPPIDLYTCDIRFAIIKGCFLEESFP